MSISSTITILGVAANKDFHKKDQYYFVHKVVMDHPNKFCENFDIHACASDEKSYNKVVFL